MQIWLIFAAILPNNCCKTDQNLLQRNRCNYDRNLLQICPRSEFFAMFLSIINFIFRAQRVKSDRSARCAHSSSSRSLSSSIWTRPCCTFIHVCLFLLSFLSSQTGSRKSRNLSFNQKAKEKSETKTFINFINNKTEVTSVKLVLFKWEKLFDILT